MTAVGYSFPVVLLYSTSAPLFSNFHGLPFHCGTSPAPASPRMISIPLALSLWSTFYLPQMSENLWYLTFTAWLNLLNIVSFESTQVVASGIISLFLWLDNIPHYNFVPIKKCIHLLIDILVYPVNSIVVTMDGKLHFLWMLDKT